MYHVLAFENGQINKITSVVDETIAKMVSEDYENCSYFDDEDNECNEKLIKWLQLRGLSREEANRVIARRMAEIRLNTGSNEGSFVANGQAIPIMGGSLQEALAQVLDRIRQIKGKQESPPDLSGVIDRFGHRISREACGTCFVCGEVAARHKDCMEPGGSKCCPSAYCESCLAAMARDDTAASIAEKYRVGPLNIVGTLSNLFIDITEGESVQEFIGWASGILTGGPSLDNRLADPQYRPVMAAIANALRDRAEMVEEMLREARKEESSHGTS
jgi:hypothetical protein